MEIVCIIIHDVVIFILRIITCSMRIICFDMLLDTMLIGPCIPFYMNICMSISVRSSKSIFVCLSKTSQDNPGVV